MNNYKAFVITASLLSFPVCAEDKDNYKLFTEPHLVVSSSIGTAWSKAGENQTFSLAPSIVKSYRADKSTTATVSGEIFLGAQKTLSSQLIGEFGLVIGANSGVELEGQIWDEANPQFHNYNYQYEVSSKRVALKGKLIFKKVNWAAPWISATIGAGFNRAHNYTTKALIPEALPSANFESESETSLTYSIGFGLQKAMSKNWQLGFGYEFTDWGKSELRRAPGQTTNSVLSLNKLYTDGILFNVSYIN